MQARGGQSLSQRGQARAVNGARHDPEKQDLPALRGRPGNIEAKLLGHNLTPAHLHDMNKTRTYLFHKEGGAGHIARPARSLKIDNLTRLASN